MSQTNTLSRRQKANAIRALSMDAVERAKSGHPGAPMGMADMAEVLWSDYLKHNPKNPNWFNRDRFVLSNGHASMLLYSLLHLTGYDLTIEDLKNFRQLHSKTPGHPEHGYTPGVETTTGPLGQGFANAVGFAIAEKLLANHFNQDNFNIVDHHTYVFLGDGCLMEGVSHEAASLAGTLGLGKLIAFWDDNNISIDGKVTQWFNENTADRFKAYGWQVIENIDGHNPEDINKAIKQAVGNSEQPTLICCRTVIGYGSPNKQNTAGVHGAPLGSEEVAKARAELNWQFDPFDIQNDYYKAWDCCAKGQALETEWNALFAKYEAKYPEQAKEFLRRMHGELPANWDTLTTDYICSLQAGQKDTATRMASQAVLSEFGPRLPELFGGSADLTGSNGTLWDGATTIDSTNNPNWDGNYLHYGVREFGMTAICNGMALHGGFVPYSGTFLTFLDYARNAVRMAALMKQRNILVYTHDSIALGEDGPTHQPIEHLAMLRVTPNLECWRPCDAVETAVAWQQAIANKDKPTALALTRQNVKAQARSSDTLNNIAKGGYILSDCEQEPDLVFIATGSEVELATAAQKELASDYNIRVVSLVCLERFKDQDESYQNEVLGDNPSKRLVIEAGTSLCWHEYVSSGKQIIGIDSFGESAPAGVLFKHFGFTVDNVVARAKQIL
jgi:transketolase